MEYNFIYIYIYNSVKMKIQCIILAMFLSIHVLCIKLMTYGNIFGLETLLSSVTGIWFLAHPQSCIV